MKHLKWVIPLIALLICVILLMYWQNFKYSPEELQIIRQLKAKMHNPKSVEIVSITKIRLSQLPTNALLVISSVYYSKNRSFYKVDYRSENVYGALRTHTVYAVHTKVICVFFTKDGKIL